MRNLAFHLEPAERRALADEILGQARRVAQVVGNFLGFGGISRAELQMLGRIEKALNHG